MANQMHVVEARTPGGGLNPLSAAQPPFPVASTRQLFEYVNEHSDLWLYESEPEHWAKVVEWFAAKGWAIRPKTW